MYTLGIDIFSSRKEKSGVEWYTYHLLRAMEVLTPPEWRVFLYGLKGEPNNEPERTLRTTNQSWEEKKLSWPPRRGYGQVRLSWEMIRRPPNVLFMPHAVIPFIHPHSVGHSTVTTIHDIGFLVRPELYDAHDRLRQITGLERARRHAAAVFSVSEVTKRDLVERAGFDEKKIIVTPLGVDHDRYRPHLDASRVREKYKLPASYFLYVGRVDAKKNLTTLIRAFASMTSDTKLADRPKQYHLVIVGSSGFRAQEVRDLVRDLGIEDRVHFLNWVSEDELPFLYAGAEAFVFPSAYEGFGLPVLQAMACGVPTVCSDIPALREVAGDAALFVEPFDESAWHAALDRILTDEKLRTDLIAHGIARDALFSWNRCAEKTWQGICGILSN